MKRSVMAGLMLGLALVLVAAACTDQQRALLRAIVPTAAPAEPAAPPPIAVAPGPIPSPTPSPTPAFNAISIPTLPPVASGPMATLTALAPLFALPTQNAEPYVLADHGRPHFIEFHAWW